jgi:hypothetical protein
MPRTAATSSGWPAAEGATQPADSFFKTSMGPREKEKNEENLSIANHGNQHKVARRKAEDVHSLIVDRRRPAVGRSFLKAVQLDDKFGPFVEFQQTFGFVPNLLPAQTLVPRVIEAQAKLGSAVRLREERFPNTEGTHPSKHCSRLA